MAELDTDRISDLLGDGFQLKVQNNGNIQVQITDLGNLSDLDKCEMLLGAARKLFDNGILPENKETRAQVVRLSWPTGRKDPQTQKEIWVPFPQLWINKPSEAVQRSNQNSEKVEALESKVESLASSVDKLANFLLAERDNASQSTAPSKPKKVAKKTTAKKSSTSKAKQGTPPVAAPPEEEPPMMEAQDNPPF